MDPIRTRVLEIHYDSIGTLWQAFFETIIPLESITYQSFGILVLTPSPGGVVSALPVGESTREY